MDHISRASKTLALKNKGLSPKIIEAPNPTGLGEPPALLCLGYSNEENVAGRVGEE